MEEEIWKPVPTLDGVMASNFGRILLPQSIAPMPNGGSRVYTPKPNYGVVTRASKTAQHTYLAVMNRRLGNIRVHKAVCEAFHGPKPFHKAVVIHIDENSHNNRPENLKWGTQKENLNMPRFIAYCKGRTGDNNPYVKGRRKKTL